MDLMPHKRRREIQILFPFFYVFLALSLTSSQQQRIGRKETVSLDGRLLQRNSACLGNPSVGGHSAPIGLPNEGLPRQLMGTWGSQKDRERNKFLRIHLPCPGRHHVLFLSLPGHLHRLKD